MGEHVDVALRPFTWDDLSTVVDIINGCDAVDGLELGTSEAELRAWWSGPHVRPEDNACIVVVCGDAVGYGLVQSRKGDERTGFSKLQAYGAVLPAWRGKGVGTHIVAQCERRARRRLSGVPTSTVYLGAWPKTPPTAHWWAIRPIRRAFFGSRWDGQAF